MRSLFAAVSLSTLLTGAGIAADDVWIWRYDGTLQCGMGVERTLAEDKAILESLGPAVLGAQKRVVPFAIIAVCGAPTGRANTYLISDADWTTLQSSFVGPAGFAEWTFDEGSAFVFKYDGTLQCDLGKEIPLEVAEQELLDAGVSVLARAKASDGLLHPAVCGGSTGNINRFEIGAVYLDTALKLGFALISPEINVPPAGTVKPMGEGLPLPWPFPW